ncbi:MAG: type II toxin-antitoxin system RelE/ParE family toxin [Actinobacteria bacterium]|nr:type II toxin-antitoxin system RelE/ParE family toxin [Actinomycetota bacterium]
MQILVTSSFERAIKKLHANQKKSLDKAVKAIASKPELGDPKVGDLEGIYVYKFKLVDKQWLLAYRIVSAEKLKLLLIGSHENFYRDLKKSN